ncbi:MAG TPA: ATP-binding protein [Syntrophales bacterium]|nr:ATP-binding protein [Syntrophales bacterium]HPQ44010.1 ATP-binding protein [Syntrophales bacterium]
MQELALHILDIVENSTRAGANLIQIGISENRKDDMLGIEIIDNGEGMEKDTVQKASDPFYTSKTVRRVGLGIPLLAHAAHMTGGGCSIQSKKGEGTTIRANFGYSHIDRQPLGNMTATMITLIAGNPGIDFVYTHLSGGRSYTLDTREIKKELEDVPIDHPTVLQFIKEDIRDGLKEIGAGS